MIKEIIFMGRYDDDGNVVGQVKDSGRILEMIKQVNQSTEKLQHR